MNEQLTVLVLRGGPGVEREISLLSGQHVAGALAEAGFEQVGFDTGHQQSLLVRAWLSEMRDRATLTSALMYWR